MHVILRCNPKTPTLQTQSGTLQCSIAVPSTPSPSGKTALDLALEYEAPNFLAAAPVFRVCGFEDVECLGLGV